MSDILLQGCRGPIQGIFERVILELLDVESMSLLNNFVTLAESEGLLLGLFEALDQVLIHIMRPCNLFCHDLNCLPHFYHIISCLGSHKQVMVYFFERDNHISEIYLFLLMQRVCLSALLNLSYRLSNGASWCDCLLND